MGHPFSSKNSSSRNSTSLEHEGEVALSPAHSSGHIVAPTTMDSIAKQLRTILINMDIRQHQRYDDCNKLVSFINDIQLSQNEILEHFDSIFPNHCRTNDHLRNLEDRVENIDFHIHDHARYVGSPTILHPHPPP